MREQLLARLNDGLTKMGLLAQPDKLVDYLMLLIKWNKAYNLTAIRDPIEMVDKHLLDSLAILPYLHGERLLDVGTGAGLPGIPIALTSPQYQVTLLDSNGKKTRFLQAVKRELNLSHIEIIHGRVEETVDEIGFDCILSRAFSDLNQMLQYTKHLIKPEGVWLAMKGRVPQQELESIHYPYTVYHCEVPHLQQSRCVVKIQQSR
jgi:16S rRNA (guanine527-N7)-methyltransferase